MGKLATSANNGDFGDFGESTTTPGPGETKPSENNDWGSFDVSKAEPTASTTGDDWGSFATPDPTSTKDTGTAATVTSLASLDSVPTSDDIFGHLVEEIKTPVGRTSSVLTEASSTFNEEEENDVLEKGEKVFRKGQPCTILKVDHGMDPPSYIVRMDDDGREVNTERRRLSRKPQQKKISNTPSPAKGTMPALEEGTPKHRDVGFDDPTPQLNDFGETKQSVTTPPSSVTTPPADDLGEADTPIPAPDAEPIQGDSTYTSEVVSLTTPTPPAKLAVDIEWPELSPERTQTPESPLPSSPDSGPVSPAKSLSDCVDKLIKLERLEEALACRKHLESESEITSINSKLEQTIKAALMDPSKLDEAMQLRKQQQTLQDQLCDENTQKRWMDNTKPTIRYKKLAKKCGSSFKERFPTPLVQLARTSLENALSIQREMVAFSENGGIQQSDLEWVIVHVANQLKTGAAALSEIAESTPQEGVPESHQTKLEKYAKGLKLLRLVGYRAGKLLNDVAVLDKLIPDLSQSWIQIGKVSGALKLSKWVNIPEWEMDNVSKSIPLPELIQTLREQNAT